MEDFEKDIWPKILQIASEIREKEEPVYTIDKPSKNWVLTINPGSITVVSDRNQRNQPGGTPRTILKDDFKEIWMILAKKGKMNREDMLREVLDESPYRRTGAITRGFLALLPNVRVEKIKGKATLIYT